ncbi:hypothetical protein DFH08DRAFT_1045016 [Mycena albidolilacea]|uniref:Uncharacterized protein n=1 Tax=Mycena albidolilacea TaxID=1033008 RepID=A0AAD6Z8S8_9AGAR|nr:hypothetical protein DFH08DRAFT_1045016 [Mycena albidolilacea]
MRRHILLLLLFTPLRPTSIPQDTHAATLIRGNGLFHDRRRTKCSGAAASAFDLPVAEGNAFAALAIVEVNRFRTESEGGEEGSERDPSGLDPLLVPNGDPGGDIPSFAESINIQQMVSRKSYYQRATPIIPYLGVTHHVMRPGPGKNPFKYIGAGKPGAGALFDGRLNPCVLTEQTARRGTVFWDAVVFDLEMPGKKVKRGTSLELHSLVTVVRRRRQMSSGIHREWGKGSGIIKERVSGAFRSETAQLETGVGKKLKGNSKYTSREYKASWGEPGKDQLGGCQALNGSLYPYSLEIEPPATSFARMYDKPELEERTSCRIYLKSEESSNAITSMPLSTSSGMTASIPDIHRATLYLATVTHASTLRSAGHRVRCADNGLYAREIRRPRPGLVELSAAHPRDLEGIAYHLDVARAAALNSTPEGAAPASHSDVRRERDRISRDSKTAAAALACVVDVETLYGVAQRVEEARETWAHRNAASDMQQARKFEGACGM